MISTKKAYIRENLRRSILAWKEVWAIYLLGGCIIASIIGTFALKIPEPVPEEQIKAGIQYGFGFYFFLHLILVTPYLMWKDLYKLSIAKLEIFFVEEDRQEYRQKTILKDNHSASGLYYDVQLLYRVGIKNPTFNSIEVKLVLEDCERLEGEVPIQDSIYRCHTFTVTAQPKKEEKATAHPSGDGPPSVFFDIVFERYNATEQQYPDDLGTGGGISLSYFQNVIGCWIANGKYLLTLRVDSSGAPCRKQFIIKKMENDERLTMYEAFKNHTT